VTDTPAKPGQMDPHRAAGIGWLFRRPRWTHYLGTTALFLLILQMFTGFLLLLYYQPNAQEAHDSVRVIMVDIPMGWIIRTLHYRSSHLLIIILMLHTLDVLLAKTFRKRRSPSYYSGVFLLFCTLFMGFTGYLLPWDTLSVVATAVGTGLFHELPLIGRHITEFFRGGATVGAQTLPRFFAFHVSMIPMIVGLGLGLHLFFVGRHGMRRPLSALKKRMPLYPDFILRQSLICVWVFAILLIAAILFPCELRPEGDLMAPAPEGIKPEWYFLAAFEVIRLGGDLTFLTPLGITAELLSLILLGAVCVVFVVMPVLDRQGPGRRWKWIIRVTALACVFMTIYAMFRSAPGTESESVAEVTTQISGLRIRALGFLLPFCLSILALTWVLLAQIQLHDRITASSMSAQFVAQLAHGTNSIGRKKAQKAQKERVKE
jgi:quinol-cytochrome oxidoreductase complex cytochrome b subunit